MAELTIDGRPKRRTWELAEGSECLAVFPGCWGPKRGLRVVFPIVGADRRVWVTRGVTYTEFPAPGLVGCRHQTWLGWHGDAPAKRGAGCGPAIVRRVIPATRTAPAWVVVEGTDGHHDGLLWMLPAMLVGGSLGSVIAGAERWARRTAVR